MFDNFMFKLGGKIGPWPFWTYIWEGGGELTGFPPSIDVSSDVSIDVSIPVSIDVSIPVSIDVSTDVFTDVRIYAHLLSFSFFGGSVGDIGSTSFYEKLRFPIVFSTTVWFELKI